MLFETTGQTMAVGHRFFTRQYDFFRGFRTDMGQIAKYPNAVHFRDHLMTKPGEATVSLVASRSDQILCVVAHLYNTDAQVFEDLHVRQLILKRVRVLEAHHHTRLTFSFGL